MAEFKSVFFGMVALIATMALGVQAVDILGFTNAKACSGAGFTFPGISARVCASMNVGSVLIRNLRSCQTGRVYKNGGCRTQVGKGNGPTVRCFVGGGYTGGDWLNGCAQSKLPETERATEPVESAKCTHQDAPNGVHYTDNPAVGSWVLKTSKAEELLGQLLNVPDEEKAGWLQALGAHFITGMETVVIA